MTTVTTTTTAAAVNLVVGAHRRPNTYLMLLEDLDHLDSKLGPSTAATKSFGGCQRCESLYHYDCSYY